MRRKGQWQEEKVSSLIVAAIASGTVTLLILSLRLFGTLEWLELVSYDWIRDQIILIGNVAESAKDFFSNPFSAGEVDDHRMPGVIVHAQMVSQFLDAGWHFYGASRGW